MDTPFIYVSLNFNDDLAVFDLLEDVYGSKARLVSSKKEWRENHKLEDRNNKSKISQLISVTGITIVVNGERTGESAWMEYEIKEAIRKKNGLFAYSNPFINPIDSSIPSRLEKNLILGSGYAALHTFPENQIMALSLVNKAQGASKKRIRLGIHCN